MVATVVGSRLGLQQTSAWVLGSRGQIGSSALGRGGESVFVNAATGNLVATNRDEFLVGLGPDAAISRSYNSESTADGDNSDGWRVGARTIVDTGGVITRTDWDGSVITYTQTSTNNYRTVEGSGAYDTLVKNPTTSVWTWTDGDTKVTETYGASGTTGVWRITNQTDTDGNSLSFTYTGGGLLSRVTTQDGAYTDYTWSGTNLTQLVSTYYDTGTASWKNQTRTRYAYDGSNRLVSVTVDLSPTDSSVSDGKTYVTTYTYDGTSKRVNSISQTDGSRIDITYESSGQYRVTQISQTVSTGVTRSTSYEYYSSTITRVMDSAGYVTELEYDAAGLLKKITESAATAGGTAQVTEITYDGDQNVVRLKTAPDVWTDYLYDDIDGNGTTGDINGLWTHQYQRAGAASYLAARRTYDPATNAVLTETRFQGTDSDGKEAAVTATGAMTTRYAYDGENHLRYSVAANGEVTEYDYYTNGNLARTTVFTGERHPLTSLSWNQSLSTSALDTWVGNITDKTAATITELAYDSIRQSLVSSTTYSAVLSTGLVDTASAYTQTNLVYDQSGRLLSRNVSGRSGSETFVYDGMGRMVSSVDYNSVTTSSVFLDAAGMTVVRHADGLNEISSYNRAGELIGFTQTERSANLIDAVGWPSNPASVPSGTATVPGWLNYSPFTNETQWLAATGPNGENVVVMRAGQSDGNVNGGGNLTHATAIDSSKAYEFVYYFKKTDLTKHEVYFGLGSGSPAYVENITNGVDDANGYFYGAGTTTQQSTLQNERWYKVVGYVLPQGTTTGASSLGGVYDMSTGAKVASTTTFRWNAERPDNNVISRFFLYGDQTSTGYSTQFYKPEVRQIDAAYLGDAQPATGTQYRYDSMGRVRLQIDPTGVRTHHLYDRVGRKVADIDADGSLVEYKYDLANRLIATVRYATKVSSTNLASLTDAAGNPTGVELSTIRPSAVAADAWTWTVYDDAGRVLQTIEGEGSTTVYAYDGASRLIATTQYATRLTGTQLTTFKSTPPTTVTAPSTSATYDRTTRYFHDDAGRQIGTLDADGFLSTVTYDAGGRVIQTSAFSTAANSSLWAGGTLSQLITSVGTVTGSDIHTWSVYDGRGFLRGAVNGEGDVTLFDYDALGQVTQVIRGRKLSSLPSSQPTLSALTSASYTVLETVTYTRNNYGQVLTEARTVSGGTETITYSYDVMRRLTSVATDVVPSGADRIVYNRYDRRGRLIGQLSAEGAADLAALGGSPTRSQIDQVYRRWGVTFAYDDGDRLISRIDRDGTYGAAGNKTLFFYDGDGRLSHEVNALGEVKEYRYDAMGRLTETLQRANRISTSGLSGGFATSALTSLIINSGSDRRTAIVYNTDDTIKQTTAWVSDGASSASYANTVTTAFEYNAFREVSKRLNEIGAFSGSAPSTTETTFAYSRRGLLLTTVADAGSGKLNATVSAVYDAFGRTIQTTDANNKPRSTTYDRAGRVKEVFDALGNKTTYGHDERGNTVSITNRMTPGLATTFAYNAFNRQVVMTTPEGLQTTTTYDDRGLVLTVQDGGSRTESYAYDKNGNLISATDGEGKVTTYTYDKADRLTETTDATSRKVQYTYDAANRQLTEAVDPAGLNLVTTYLYDGLGDRVRITDASGVRTDVAFDGLGRTTTVVVDPLNLALTTVSTYDRAGNLTRLREASGAGTTVQRDTNFTYDNLGRMTTRENGDTSLGIRSEYVYDLNGNVTKRRDRISLIGGLSTWADTRFVYDAENRLILTIDPMGGVSRTVYDAEGRVTRTLGYATALTSTALAALTDAPTEAQITSVLTTSSTTDHSTALVYDDDGRLVFTLDAANQLTEKIYDGSGNVIRQVAYATPYTASQTPSETALRLWLTSNTSTADRTSRATYDGANRQVYGIDAAGQVTAFFYDDAGRTLRSIRYATIHTTSGDRTVAQMNSWASSNANAADRKSHIAYDGAGRATFTVDAEGYVTRSTYNGVGDVLTSTRFAPMFSVSDGVTHATLTSLVASHTSTAATTTLGYDSAGRHNSTIDAEGIETRLILNALGQVTEVRVAHGTSQVVSTARDYDDAGRLIQEKWAAGVSGVEQTLTWTYDALGRVLTAVDGKGYTTVRTYDAMGRVLTVATPISSTVSALTQNTYDAFGNLVRVIDPVGSTQTTPADSAGFFYYDALNRLVTQVDPERHVTQTTYTLGGEVATVTRRAARATGTPTVTAPPNIVTGSGDATTTFTRDKLDRLTGVTDAGGYSETYSLNAFGDRTSLTNKVGGVTTYTYDKRGLMLTETLPVSSVSAAGTVLATTVVNTFEYDARGNLTKTIESSNISADTRTTVYTYDKLDRLTQTTGDAITVTSATDFSTSTVTPTETVTYDLRGNVIQTQKADGAKTLFYYDALNRKVFEVDALGTARTWAYDLNNNATSSKVYDTTITVPSSPGGSLPSVSGTYREVFNEYDRANQLKRTWIASLRVGEYGTGYVTTTADVETAYAYDANGNVTQTTDGRGNSSYAFYDKLGRQSATLDAEGYLTTYTRDAEGNVTSEVRYGIKVTGVTSTPPRTASATLGDRITDFTYDKNGRRLTETRRGVEVYAGPPDADRMTTADATITYEYNGLGAVTKRTEANSDYTDYTYDNLGRQLTALEKAFTDFENNSVRHLTTTAYDGLGGVTRIVEGKATSSSIDRVTTFTYVKGRLATATDGNGQTRTFGHDVMGRVTKESYSRELSDTTTVTEGKRYGYDLLGRSTFESSASYSSTWSFGDKRSQVYNAHGEVIERRLNDVVQETFSYDKAGRLWRSTAGDGVARYMLYDKAGKVTLTVSPVGGMSSYSNAEDLVTWLTTSGTYAIGAQNLTGAALTFTVYDKRGMALTTREPWRELGRDPVTSTWTRTEIVSGRTYNAFGEVITETDGRGYTTEYSYNTMGRLIERRSPEVDYTDETGTVHTNVRPTEQYRYDVSGRLVATRSANGYWTTRTLLSNSGHNGEEAVVLEQVNPDGGTWTNKANVFGELALIGNSLGGFITNIYDKVGNLVERDQIERGAWTTGNQQSTATQLKDYYAYDILGQRIRHTNNVFGTSKERTDYDREGRVVFQADFEGRSNSYSYSWNASLTTGGMQTFGGWEKTSSFASGKTSSEKIDGFGRTIERTDMDSRVYTMTYDQAGRLVLQTSVKASVGLQNITYTWYNTGQLAEQNDASTVLLGYSVAHIKGSFTYDENGNRLRERYVASEVIYAISPDAAWDPYVGTYTPPTPTYATVVRQDGYADYDALGRMKKFQDKAVNSTAPTVVEYTFDLNGNVRSTASKHTPIGATAANTTFYTSWNAYDSMNRMVRVEAGMVDGVMNGGKFLEYDTAGNRRRMKISVGTVTDNIVDYTPVWVPDPDPGEGGGGMEELPGENGHWDYIPVYETLEGYSIEHYNYTADGYLAEVGTSHHEWDTVTNTVFETSFVLRATDKRDALGRVTLHKEYAEGSPSGRTHEQSVTYDKAGLITTETSVTYSWQYALAVGTAYYSTVTSTYNYTEGSTWRGVVTSVTTTGSTDVYPEGGSTVAAPNTRTDYTYSWRDSALQTRIVYDKNTASSDPDDIQTSILAYDVNGFLSFVNIKDGRDRNITFVTDQTGQVMRRTEADTLSTDDPISQFHYFNGKRIGEVTNNGMIYNSSYNGEVYARRWPKPNHPTPFQTGSVAIPGQDYDLAYVGLTPDSVPTNGQAWTVREGDSLQSIAAAIWGDGSLWYLIAEANGLHSGSLLTAGQTLIVPAKIGNVHSTSDTFRPYDPNRAVGDVSPSQPTPPKNNTKGCGIIGQFFMAIIATVVVALVFGPAMAAAAKFFAAAGLGTTATGAAVGSAAATTIATTGAGVTIAAGSAAGIAGAIAGGAIAGAAGSIVSQAFGVVTGIQEEFDWKALGISAISGAVGGGLKWTPLGKMTGMSGAFARGAVSSVLTQGVAVATGLQDKFSWSQVAVSAVMAAVGEKMTRGLPEDILEWKSEHYGRMVLANTTSAFAGAATMSLLDGTSFGDNLIAVLPQAMGQTVGQMVAMGVYQSAAQAAVAKARAEGRPAETPIRGCFLPHTPVVTREGQRPISEISIGDWVASRNEFDSDAPVRFQPVTDVLVFDNKSVLDITFRMASGHMETISVTSEHPFHVKKVGWVEAGDLRLGAVIDTHDSRYCTVTAIAQGEQGVTVHNLTVDEDHTYFVGQEGIWVHNKMAFDPDELDPDPDDGLVSTTPPIWRGPKLYSGEVGDKDAYGVLQVINDEDYVPIGGEGIDQIITTPDKGDFRIVTLVRTESGHETYLGLNSSGTEMFFDPSLFVRNEAGALVLNPQNLVTPPPFGPALATATSPDGNFIGEALENLIAPAASAAEVYPSNFSSGVAGPQLSSNGINFGGGSLGTETALTRGVGVQINNNRYNFSLTRPPGSYMPKGGSTSVGFLYNPARPDIGIRLDYGWNKNSQIRDWHWNQKGTFQDLGVRNHATNGNPGLWGNSLRALKVAGRLSVVYGAYSSVNEIYNSDDRAYEAGRQASGWVGAIAGGELGAQGGAAAGAAVGLWFGGVGAIPGAAIGGFVGGVVGGTLGWMAGTEAYEAALPQR